MAGILTRLADGFTNLVSRLGSSADKTSADTYAVGLGIDLVEADAAYRSTWFRKIVDIPPFDAVREWRAWKATKEQIEALEETEAKLNIRAKLARAMILGRKDGGGALLIGNADRNLASELVPGRVGADGLQFVQVLNRQQISPTGGQVQDVFRPDFGGPMMWTLNGGPKGEASVEVHPSRVIAFRGNERMDNNYGDGWGDSLWGVLARATKNVDLTGAAMAALVHEAKTDVVKVAGLMNNLSTEAYESLFLRRWNLVAQLKSIHNVTLLDKEDDWDQRTLNFAGLPDVMGQAMLVLSGLADIPQTRLYGRSPQGMNATGDSDLKNYYDRIGAHQELELRPALTILDEVLIRSALGTRPPEVHYTWAPLYELTEQEQATVEKTFAEAIKIVADAGLLPDSAVPTIVANRMIESGAWPGMEQAIEDAEAEGELAPFNDPEREAQEQEAELANIAAAATAKNGGKPPLRVVGADGLPRLITDATPRTLYVRRDVLNGAAIREWATGQGFASTVTDLHVTVAFSRTPVDWLQMGNAAEWDNPRGTVTVPRGGPRLVERLGADAVVLLFASSELSWRHLSMRERGASWDHEEYQPHVTLTYAPGDVDLDTVKPYTGPIELGPEIFEEIVDDWAAGVTEE